MAAFIELHQSKAVDMSRRGEMFAGLSVALVTPMNADGSLNESMLRDLVDFHVESGTNCLVPVGTTGESPTLSHDEHNKVIEVVCEHAAGRVKVMAGTGSNCTAEAIRMTQHAKDVGADGSLQVAPYYNKPTQEGFFQHYKAISDAVDLPSVLYNIPGRSAKNIEPQTICRIAEACPNVVAVKEATGSLDQASQILAASDLTVLSGDDSLTLPLMSWVAVALFLSPEIWFRKTCWRCLRPSNLAISLALRNGITSCFRCAAIC